MPACRYSIQPHHQGDHEPGSDKAMTNGRPMNVTLAGCRSNE
jgi:hypothetical protein